MEMFIPVLIGIAIEDIETKL